MPVLSQAHVFLLCTLRGKVSVPDILQGRQKDAPTRTVQNAVQDFLALGPKKVGDVKPFSFLSAVETLRRRGLHSQSLALSGAAIGLSTAHSSLAAGNTNIDIKPKATKEQQLRKSG